MKWNDGKYDATIAQKHYATFDEINYSPHTVASAIEISRPVNLPKALRALSTMNGVVREVTDDEILEHRALVARYGFGCEPASAASVAGLRKLLEEQVISKDESVVCILTGHELKDPNATVQYHTGIDMKSVQDLAPRVEPRGKLSNRPVPVDDDLPSIIKAMGGDAELIANLKVSAGKSNVPVGEF
jgi:threonine synthase